MTMLVYSLLGFATTEAGTSDTYRQVEVQQNDTLWSIANKYSGNTLILAPRLIRYVNLTIYLLLM